MYNDNIAQRLPMIIIVIANDNNYCERKLTRLALCMLCRVIREGMGKLFSSVMGMRSMSVTLFHNPDTK